jgi:hypothetical protein
MGAGGRGDTGVNGGERNGVLRGRRNTTPFRAALGKTGTGNSKPIKNSKVMMANSLLGMGGRKNGHETNACIRLYSEKFVATYAPPIKETGGARRKTSGRGTVGMDGWEIEEKSGARPRR